MTEATHADETGEMTQNGTEYFVAGGRVVVPAAGREDEVYLRADELEQVAHEMDHHDAESGSIQSLSWEVVDDWRTITFTRTDHGHPKQTVSVDACDLYELKRAAAEARDKMAFVGDDDEDDDEDDPAEEYPFDIGDYALVDWANGEGPQTQITGEITDITASPHGDIVEVTDNQHPDYPRGRAYDCAPEWIKSSHTPDDE